MLGQHPGPRAAETGNAVLCGTTLHAFRGNEAERTRDTQFSERRIVSVMKFKNHRIRGGGVDRGDLVREIKPGVPDLILKNRFDIQFDGFGIKRSPV